MITENEFCRQLIRAVIARTPKEDVGSVAQELSEYIQLLRENRELADILREDPDAFCEGTNMSNRDVMRAMGEI